MENFKEKIENIWEWIHDFVSEFGWMILMVIGMGIMISIGGRKCSRDNKESLYYNEKLVIVRTSNGDGYTQDKFHRPINVKIWLVRRVKDTTDYAELSSAYDGSYPNNFRISNELWYSKNVGDILHFEKIRKDRFFKINK